jgi:hypothetical protein
MRILYFILIIACSVGLNAQNMVSDSAETGVQYQDAVYYNVSTLAKTTTSNLNWHLAFSVRPSQYPTNTLQGVTVRYNEAHPATPMTVTKKALTDTAFYTADTTGLSTWPILHDYDSSMDTGAFNIDLNISAFDYGWGIYNSAITSKNVEGKTVYFVKIGSTGFKKLRIEECTYDTAWRVRYANLDNSEMRTATINKRQFAGKNFAYLNLLNDSVLDKEPLSANWDLVFTRYTALDVPTLPFYPSTGVLSNKGVQTVQVSTHNVANEQYAAQPFSSAMNIIGRDWKEYIAPDWFISDTTVYFVKRKTGGIYKMVMTGFGGSATGKIYFDIEHNNTATAITEVSNTGPIINIYPNPASGTVHVITDSQHERATIAVTSIDGRTMELKTTGIGLQSTTFELSHYAPGYYIVLVRDGEKTFRKQFILN